MISVVIPCYNSESFLSRAIESVFRQTYVDWEIILVNNNSIDGTQKIIDQYVSKFPNKVFSLFEDRKGACYARNLGLSIAKGEWIQFLDADDELLPDKLERQLKIGSGEADVIVGAFIRVNVEEGKNTYFNVDAKKSIWHSILYSQAGITSSNLYRKVAVLRIGGWNAQMSSSQEYDLMFRLLKSKAVLAFDTVFSARIYEEPNSISRPTSQEGIQRQIDTYINVRLRAAEYLNSINAWDTALHKNYSVRIYGMLMNRRYASRKLVEQKVKELSLKVPIQSRFFFILKYYVKKMVFNRYYNLLRR